MLSSKLLVVGVMPLFLCGCPLVAKTDPISQPCQEVNVVSVAPLPVIPTDDRPKLDETPAPNPDPKNGNYDVIMKIMNSNLLKVAAYASQLENAIAKYNVTAVKFNKELEAKRKAAAQAGGE